MPAQFESDMNTLPTERQAQGGAHEQASEASVVVVELLHEDARLPVRATPGSAGYDVCAYLHGRTVDCSDGTRQWSIEAALESGEWRLELAAGAMALVPLGFKARLPADYEAQVRPRSGAAFKKGLAIPNAPGTVDADFPDEWRVIVRNTTAAPLVITHGERIAQVVLHRYEVLPFVRGTVGRTTERAGGFGSTGQ
jgi:dUTP pyrophosphatase